MENPSIRNLSRLQRVFLTLCSLFLAASLPIVAAAVPLESVIFQPAPLLSALESMRFYQEYPRLLIAFSAAGGDLLTPGLGSWLGQNLANRGGENALRFIFPADWVRAQTGHLVSEYFAYTNFSSSSLDLSLDLRAVKLRLSAGEGRQLIEQTLSVWPTCILDDTLLATALILQGRTAELPRCKPADELIPAYLEMLQLGMNVVAAGIPDRLQLLPPRTTPAAGIYAILRWLVRISPLALLFFSLAAAALIGRSGRSFLAWAGPPLYAGGLLALLSVGLVIALAVWLLPLPLPALSPPLAELYRFFAGVFLIVWREFLLGWSASGAAFASLGMILIFISSVLDRKHPILASPIP
jgi:hypothetical protein